MASDPTFSAWYFAYCEHHNCTPDMGSVWQAGRDYERATLSAASPATAPQASEKPSGAADTRECTCHPGDRPAICQRQFALSECQKAALASHAETAPQASEANLPPYIYGRECGPNEKVWTESTVRAALAATQATGASAGDALDADYVRHVLISYHSNNLSEDEALRLILAALQGAKP